MSSTLATLKAQFLVDAVDKDSPGHAQAIHRYFKNAEKPARLVLYPSSTADIAVALKFCKAEGVDFVVCGGGHSAGGASSIDDGVVIDLGRHFDKVEVVLGGSEGGATGQAYVKAGGGSRWVDVDKATMEHGLATVAGLVNHTGVGGFTLGGGYGWLTTAHGVTSDNLLGATVVLASGEVLEVDKDNHPDLFWALRGGGGAFGIVTEFRLKLHPTSKVAYVRFIAVPATLADRALPIFLEWSKKLDSKTAGGMAFDLGPDGKPIIVHWAAFLGPKAEVEDRLVGFDLLEGHQVVIDKEMPYEETNGIIGDFEPEGSTRYWTSTFTVTSLEVYQKIFRIFIEDKAGQEVPGAHLALEAVAFNMDKIASVPVGATAFPHRNPKATILQFNLVWPNADDFDAGKAHQFMAHLREIVADTAESKGGYSNFEANQSAARAKDVYGDNLERLQAIKAQYDPDQTFGGKFGL